MDALAEGTETVVAELLPDPSLGPIPNYTVDPKRTAAKKSAAKRSGAKKKKAKR